MTASRAPRGITIGKLLERTVERAVGLQQPDDLADEERVALGPLPDAANERLRRLDARGRLDQLGDAALVEAGAASIVRARSAAAISPSTVETACFSPSSASR